jgi:SAM-dependent methyltransferase
MGDQKYLDDWPTRFAGVHVVEHPGAGLAPWNVSQYTVADERGRVTVDGRDLVFFHYHSLRLYKSTPGARAMAALADEPRHGPGLLWSSNYPAPPVERQLIWEPYLSKLVQELEHARSVSPRLRGGIARWSIRDQITPVGVARFALNLGRHGLERLRTFDPQALRRHRNSWRSADVARQMVHLSERQLAAPEEVAPYRSFLTGVTRLLEHDHLPEPARLLDIGCGVGAYADLLDRYFPGRFDYTGADYSEEVLDVARRRAPSRSFERLDLLEDGVPGGFDVVLASALVDVIPDWERALDRLLAADARVVILHRQRISDHESHVDLVPGYRGQRTYATRLSVGDIERIAARHGRRIADSVPVEGEMSSFLLVRGLSA